MASADLRTAVRTGAAHLDRMAARLAEIEAGGRVTEPAYAELLHHDTSSSAGTRSTSGWTPR